MFKLEILTFEFFSTNHCEKCQLPDLDYPSTSTTVLIKVSMVNGLMSIRFTFNTEAISIK